MSEQDEKKDDDLDIAAIAAQFKEGDPVPKVDLVDVNVIETEPEAEAERRLTLRKRPRRSQHLYRRL